MSYYLSKSNPRVYKLQEALIHYRGLPDVYWTICKDAEIGDIIFIGQSGSEAGIYAKAIVASIPSLQEPDDKFWVNIKDTKEPMWMAHLSTLVIHRHPVLERILKTVPLLTAVVKWLHSQGAGINNPDVLGCARRSDNPKLVEWLEQH